MTETVDHLQDDRNKVGGKTMGEGEVLLCSFFN